MAEVKKLQRGNGKSQPVYKQISRLIRTQIESGKVCLGDRLPAISKLASQYKIDYKTVNSALQDLEERGFIRCEAGRGKGAMVLKDTGRRYSIMFIRWSHDSLSLGLTDGIGRFAKEKSLEYIVVDASYSHEHFVDAMVHPIQNVDGIIVMPHELPDYREATIKALDSGVKVVFVDRYLEGVGGVSSVSVDHVNGAYKATKHLLDAHGLPVYYIGSTKDPSSVRDRLCGWSTAMRQYHFEKLGPYICASSQPEYELVLDEKRSVQVNCEAMVEFFRNHNEGKYSIFAINDNVAMSVYLAADKVGLEIGVDVYLASFGDTPCKQKNVPLTSIPQLSEEVGYEAARLLFMDLIGALQRPMRRLLPVELHIRESSIGGVKSPLDKQISGKREIQIV